MNVRDEQFFCIYFWIGLDSRHPLADHWLDGSVSMW